MELCHVLAATTRRSECPNIEAGETAIQYEYSYEYFQEAVFLQILWYVEVLCSTCKLQPPRSQRRVAE